MNLYERVWEYRIYDMRVYIARKYIVGAYVACAAGASCGDIIKGAFAT